jgi:hypothetical protein
VRKLCPLLLALSVPLPLHVGAQAVGALTGKVIASDATPLAQAQVRIVSTATGPSVTSGNDGRFALPAVNAGDQMLEIRLLGYIAVVQPVTILAGQTIEVQVMLTVAPVPLKAVEVKGAPVSRMPVIVAFENRRAHGSGHFFTRSEIARIQPRVLTDVLRRVPGVQIQTSSSAFGPGEYVRMSRTIGVMGARTCPVLYYVNGTPFQVAGEISINQYIIPEDVLAIEVYSGTSQIPPEFQSSLLNARCGVVVIWTRLGNEEDSPQQE